MSFIESYLSNKPKQCILTILFYFSVITPTTSAHVVFFMCSGPYHYKTSCEGVHELKRKYDYWKNEQRLPFMQQYRQDQSSNAEQLDEYNKRKLQLEKDQRVADAMKKAEEADELYKSQHCVSCPKCKRVIQHMGGCDGKLFFFYFSKRQDNKREKVVQTKRRFLSGFSY